MVFENPSPQVRLVARAGQSPARQWEHPLPDKGVWKVSGPAGVGVSSLLIDVALAQIEAGTDPRGILILAASKETGARMRRELSARLAGTNYASDAPLVRSVHSLAFALMREASPTEIRLITGAEQDAVIRELLHGQAQDRPELWPEQYRPALTYVGFARQLRDFLLRCVERGLSPADLEDLGQQFDRPMWQAAGAFLREYQQTMALSGAQSYTSYSAAELVSLAAKAPLGQEVLGRWHTIIVDDAQHLDPQSAALIERLLPFAQLAVIGGDLEQAVFRFRGASTKFFAELDAPNYHPGNSTKRCPVREVTVVDSDTAQHAFLADTIRRAHLLDGQRWSDIAVIVRSMGQIAPVRRALLAAGVPVHLNPTDVVLAEQHIVANMLLGLKALSHTLRHSELEALLLGPVGGADPVTLRRLIRGLRRFAPETRGMDTLAQLLSPGEKAAQVTAEVLEVLDTREQEILSRMSTVLNAGREALAHGSIEEVLWAVWAATDLSSRLQYASLRGGASGSQADRDLDAMMTLFDAAGDYAERRPTGSIEGFIAHIQEQELPTGVRDRRLATPEAVTILTAHGAVGQEWPVVLVAGLQEGAWPQISETGSLFNQEELIDYLEEGIVPGTIIDRLGERAREEERLFHLACSRATQRLVLSSVYAPAAQEVTEPSRYVEAFAQEHGLEISSFAAPLGSPQAEYEPLRLRVLSVPHYLAHLRQVVCSEDSTEQEQRQAARQLARLAQAGVPGAHPQQWWSTTEPSSMEKLPTVRSLSPSQVEGLMDCCLRQVLGRLWDEEENSSAQVRGNLAHYYFEAVGRGVDPAVARELVLATFDSLDEQPQWRREYSRESFATLLGRIDTWVQASDARNQLLGVEVPLDVAISPELKLRGRLDRLERLEDGSVLVVDLKTSTSPLSADDAQLNPQLLSYQLALHLGQLCTENGQPTILSQGRETALTSSQELRSGGGLLVYPAKDSKKVTTRSQDPAPEDALEHLREQLPLLAASMSAPFLSATPNDGCRHCPIIHICPAQPEGKATTDA